jgi:hypothetical protein
MIGPKTLVLGANSGSWRSSDYGPERYIFSGIEGWAFAFEGDYCNTIEADTETIAPYELIIANLPPPWRNRKQFEDTLLELQRNRKQQTKWVTLIEGCATDYLAISPSLAEILDGSDLVNVINRHSVDFFRALTGTRCEYIGIPYPAKAIREQFPAGARRDVWTPLMFSAVSYTSIYAALPVVQKHGTSIHKVHRPPTQPKRKWWQRHSKDQNAVVPSLPAVALPWLTLHPLTGFTPYFELLSQSAFAFVDLDHRYTWARDVLDCAALQIPCIATTSTGHVADFFPDLVVENEFSIVHARELLGRLYEDAAFYDRCANVPLELLEPLAPEAMGQKLLSALD